MSAYYVIDFFFPPDAWDISATKTDLKKKKIPLCNNWMWKANFVQSFLWEKKNIEPNKCLFSRQTIVYKTKSLPLRSWHFDKGDWK